MRFLTTCWLVILVTGYDAGAASAASHKSRHHKSPALLAQSPGDGGNDETADGSGGQKAPAFDWDGASGGERDEPKTRITDVTTTLGQTAFLHCRVRHLADRRVLWMRQRDLHILTSALHTYTNDWRISAVHTNVRPLSVATPPTPQRNVTTTTPTPRRNADRATTDADYDDVWSEWTLRIRSTEAKDAGLYECQVSTEPKISKIYRLHVVASKASILGSTELFVKKGSDINLTCITLADETTSSPAPGNQQQLLGQQHQFASATVANGNRMLLLAPLHFAWLHNGQVLNYSARGGLSVTTDTISGHSRLLLARAAPRDSGNYTCVPGPGATPASVAVHVLNGEQPAAMQRDNSAGLVSPWWRWTVRHCWSAAVTLSISMYCWHQIVNRLTDVT